MENINDVIVERFNIFTDINIGIQFGFKYGKDVGWKVYAHDNNKSFFENENTIPGILKKFDEYMKYKDILK